MSLSKFSSLMSGLGVVVTVGSGALAAPPATTTHPKAKPVVATKAGTPTAEGEPDWKTGDVTGAWVWRDDTGEHVRFRSKVGETHTFKGDVCAKDISGVGRVDLEDGDKADLVKKKSCIDFALQSDASADGIDFVGKGTSAKMSFQLDGKAMPATDIHLGKDAQSPKGHAFKIKLAAK